MVLGGYRASFGERVDDHARHEDRACRKHGHVQAGAAPDDVQVEGNAEKKKGQRQEEPSMDLKEAQNPYAAETHGGQNRRSNSAHRER